MWAFVARHPKLYRWLTRIGIGLLSRIAGKHKKFRRLPFASAWTKQRDFPAPQGQTFMSSIGLANAKSDKDC
jgi:L-lactate dehydrogenase complex protein LldF